VTAANFTLTLELDSGAEAEIVVTPQDAPSREEGITAWVVDIEGYRGADWKPRLLDLFCCQGGAAMGYSRAGFDVVGVDIAPQPRYPFEFHQGDALEYLAAHGHEFDAIHASPPCQAFTALKVMYNAKPHPDLLTPTRAALIALGKPYVIENVEGAPMVNYVTLCGTAFGLGTDAMELRRHRRFEVSPPFLMVPPCAHGLKPVIGIYGGHWRDRRENAPVKNLPLSEAVIAMGIDWMSGHGLSQAIPPAYTEFIGRHLRAALAGTRLSLTAAERDRAYAAALAVLAGSGAE